MGGAIVALFVSNTGLMQRGLVTEHYGLGRREVAEHYGLCRREGPLKCAQRQRLQGRKIRQVRLRNVYRSIFFQYHFVVRDDLQ